MVYVAELTEAGCAQATEALETALAVTAAGWLTHDEVRRAEAWRQEKVPRMGKLAMTLGKLTMGQVFEILGQQGTRGGMFGEIAFELGYLTRNDIYELMVRQTNMRPSLLDALVSLELLTPQQALSLEKSHVSTAVT